eukprot:TRINITY_DN25874_c0_g3_i1.p1 TRINITY_DN25874_c0_g3~~TRINITY_DN25874_c0_g3_i1.p1  ORF type:complete len:608 (-),score=122.64 TRINITY_DN25874_c0_g3_i1:278-2101(-)
MAPDQYVGLPLEAATAEEIHLLSGSLADVGELPPVEVSGPRRGGVGGRRLRLAALLAASGGVALAGTLVAKKSRSAAASLSKASLADATRAFDFNILGASLEAFEDQLGGDPYVFRCPVPSSSSSSSSSSFKGSRRLGVSFSIEYAGEDGGDSPTTTSRAPAAAGSRTTSRAAAVPGSTAEVAASPSVEIPDAASACCAEYDRTGFPYQFAECGNHSSCPTCWKETENVGAHPLAPLVGVSWAASVAVGGKAEVKQQTVAGKMLDWIEDGLGKEGNDEKWLKHAELQSKSMKADMFVGEKKIVADACPGVHDWDEYMLNEGTENIHARAYKSKSRRLAVIVFRGTQFTSVKNWHVDTDIKRVPLQLGKGGPEAMVHEGFLDAARRVLPRVRRWVEGYFLGIFGDVPESWRLVFTGHSLGGALAQLATTHAEAEGWSRKPDATLAFGAPRVADDALNQWWQERGLCSKLARVNVYNDVVHRMPSRQISGLADAATRVADCVHDLSACLFGGSAHPMAEPVDLAKWVDICPTSELLVPGAMKGINPEQSDLSPLGGALSHYLGNCLFGYGFGVLQRFAASDAYCGLGSAGVCPASAGADGTTAWKREAP